MEGDAFEGFRVWRFMEAADHNLAHSGNGSNLRVIAIEGHSFNALSVSVVLENLLDFP